MLLCAHYSNGLCSFAVFSTVKANINLELDQGHLVAQTPTTIHWTRSFGDPTEFKIEPWRQWSIFPESDNQVTVLDGQTDGDVVLQFNEAGYIYNLPIVVVSEAIFSLGITICWCK
jgi:hypothetical protein